MQIGATNGMFSRSDNFLVSGTKARIDTPSMQDKMPGASEFNSMVENKSANNFSTDPITEAYNNVNASQLQAERSAELFATGQTESLHKVIVDMEEAMMSMKFATQVRNKAVEAYQEIIRMQI